VTNTGPAPKLTVGDLVDALAKASPDDYVTCSPGGGVLSGVTVCTNGYVILDATPASGEWVAERSAIR